MGFTLTGIESMARQLRQIATSQLGKTKAAMNFEAELILADSKDNYVPVGTVQGGTLRASGFIIKAVLIDGNIIVVIAYGGAASAYALAIHEHESGHSPRTWKGVELTFSRPGTGVKYLEIPLRTAQSGLAERLASKIRM